ncbi:NifB/NifX family molybdenum-iron cluster-binding protein [Paenibacillus tepidiphilus]|uniref:NifB/NifX family molybdenum-iron cluster-binding protein n=1 Tax=Paenibacillus tepidiphilus TaxID=2608683 RepID=UPI00123C6D7E|nr:NifB/NifX family molybdenum-iron cluster-binding protein [Paenibacillus tepidiphilus]
MTWRVAVGSTDGLWINGHFARCGTFWIHDIEDNGSYRLLEQRCCEGGSAGRNGHSEQVLQLTADALADCNIVLVSRIGPGAKAMLQARGIAAMAVEAPVEQAMRRLIRFLQSGKESLLYESHTQ